MGTLAIDFNVNLFVEFCENSSDESVLYIDGILTFLLRPTTGDMFDSRLKHNSFSFVCFDTDLSFTQVYCEKLKLYNSRSFSISEHPYQATQSGKDPNTSPIILFVNMCWHLAAREIAKAV